MNNFSFLDRILAKHVCILFQNKCIKYLWGILTVTSYYWKADCSVHILHQWHHPCSLFYENSNIRFFYLHSLAIFTDKRAFCSLARLQPGISHEQSLVKINNHPVTGDKKLWANRNYCLPYGQDSLCFTVEGGQDLLILWIQPLIWTFQMSKLRVISEIWVYHPSFTGNNPFLQHYITGLGLVYKTSKLLTLQYTRVMIASVETNPTHFKSCCWIRSPGGRRQFFKVRK